MRRVNLLHAHGSPTHYMTNNGRSCRCVACRASRSECNRKRYADHAEEIAMCRAEHADERAEYDRKYRMKHPEKCAERHRKYYAEHREEIINRNRKYYAEHHAATL